ncbi:MAG: hypothetical protein HQM16_08400 [Deltaproteobacteria bacterium]|nr:hypothetical protein [Deltaproteobacteria bacterium]
MNRFFYRVVLFLSMLVFVVWSQIASQPAKTIVDRDLAVLARHEFSHERIGALSQDEKKLFYHLIKTGEIMDEIYLDQVHPLNKTWVTALQSLKSAGDKTAEKILEYFFISFGPWSVFEKEEWIIPDRLLPQWVPVNIPRLKGYNLYPYETRDGIMQSVSIKELDNWLKSNPQDTDAFKSPFTVIRRSADQKGFVAIPYAVYYKKPLTEAAWHLEQAALYVSEASVKTLLTNKAEAFRTNNFYATDVFWVKTHDAELQLLIGPYEESIDEIWGVKRGFGMRIGFKDQLGTADLQTYKSLEAQFQANLPIDAKYHPDKQKEPFFTVWRQIYTAGDSRQGVQTLGQKLTNDRKFTIEHGARQSFYRNSQDGKCEKTLKPLANLVLASEHLPDVACDAFFKSTLHHEYAHALGVVFWYPDWDNPDPKTRKEVNDNLPTWGGKLEELKADTLGCYNQQYMFNAKLEDPARQRQMYATMVVGFFRSVRFGMNSSYALNAMIMLNHLVDAGAVIFDENEDGRIRIIADKVAAVLKDNARDALMLQVKNNDAAVGDYFTKWAVVRPQTQKLLDRIKDAGLPRDLYPVFPVLKELGLDNDL